MSQYKAVLLGAKGVGKTCIYSIGCKTTYKSNVSTAPSAMFIRVNFDKKQIDFYDTAGQEDYAKLRPLAYPETDVFLLTFAIDMPVSLENILNVWWKDVHTEVPKAQLMLVGTKKDLRGADPSKRCVTPDEASRVAEQIGAVKYVECSARTKEGLKEVFDQAIKVALNNRSLTPTSEKKGCGCCIM